MNIYLRELKSYRFVTLLWILSICGIALILLSFYPVIQSDMESFVKMMDNLPPLMKDFIGVAIRDLFTPLGYYGFIFTYSSLLAAIQAANLGVGIVSKEEREHTADFLITKTVTRTGIMVNKIMAVLTILIITNAVYSVVTEITLSELTEEAIDLHKFILLNLSLFIIQFIFFSIGLAVSFTMKRIKSVLPVSLGLVFVFYAISAFAVTSKEDNLRFITPFQYFKAEEILQTGRYEIGYLITGIFIIMTCISLSIWSFRRKNIPAI